MEKKYNQVKNYIMSLIEEQKVARGEKIPSERELSEALGLSRMTIRQGIELLVNEGILKKELGRGTFFATPHYQQKNIRSFTETLRAQGHTPSTIVLESAIVFRLAEISQIMGVPLETRFYKIKRLRLGNDMPIALETVYIPEKLCPDLAGKNLSDSLYAILKEDYNYVVDRSALSIDAIISNTPLNTIFRVDKPTALLKIISTHFTKDYQKIYYEEAYYRSDLYTYYVDIYR